ncbi:MAG: tetratricopeptide repeat protein, partial [Acidobacteriota bacterium]
RNRATSMGPVLCRRKDQPDKTRTKPVLRLIGPLLLFISVVALYAPSMRNDFIYDDNVVILAQAAPRSISDVARFFAERHFPDLPYYRPVTRTTLLIQKAIHGDQPAAFHLANAILIGVTALLAYALLGLPVFVVPKIPALLCSALFALHPVASSCVYPISSGRETLLPSAWTLLALYAFLRKGKKWRALTIAAFSAALFSKEQAVIVPLLFILADLLRISPEPPGRSARRWLLRYWPIVLVLITYLLIRHILFGGSEYVLGDFAGPLFSIAYALQVIITPFVELLYEPTIAIWLSPTRLIIASAIGLMLAVVAIRLGSAARSTTLFWLGWFVLTLLPTANLLQQEASYDERYAFLASLSVVAITASVASSFWHRKGKNQLVTSFGIVLIVCFAAISFHRATYFRDNVTFSRQWRRTNPGSVNAHYNMGFALARKGKLEEAIVSYSQALRIRPDHAYAHNNLGKALAEKGKLEEAVRHFSRAVNINPNYVDPHVNLGSALARQGRIDEAIQWYRRAIQLDPYHVVIHNNLGLALLEKGEVNEAMHHFSEAIKIKPDYREAQENLNRLQAR